MSDILSNTQSITIKITNNQEQEFDITQQFLVLHIWQSLINRKFMNARVVLVDTNDLIQNLPIIGNEKISIRINNAYDASFQDYEFRIYKIDRDFNTNKGQQKLKILNIYLYSVEEYNSFTRISKRFQGTGSSIIQDLFSNNLLSTKEIDVESDSSTIDFISNFWNSEKCIDYISKKTESDYYDFVFYENNLGFHYKSLSRLFQEPVVGTLDLNLQTQLTNVNTILACQFNSYFDDLIWRKRGMFGSTGYINDNDIYGYELIEKTLQEYDEDVFHTGSNEMYTDESDILNRVYTTDSDDLIKNVRTIHLNLLNRYNFVVNLNGDISRNVGDLYKVDFPSFDNESASGSDSFSGNWIVTEIKTEIFQDNKFTQNLTLAKNSLFKNQKLNKY